MLLSYSPLSNGLLGDLLRSIFSAITAVFRPKEERRRKKKKKKKRKRKKKKIWFTRCASFQVSIWFLFARTLLSFLIAPYFQLPDFQSPFLNFVTRVLRYIVALSLTLVAPWTLTITLLVLESNIVTAFGLSFGGMESNTSYWIMSTLSKPYSLHLSCVYSASFLFSSPPAMWGSLEKVLKRERERERERFF